MLKGHQAKEKFFPTPSGISRQDAETACKLAFGQSSPLQQCKTYAGVKSDDYIYMCIEDLKVTSFHQLLLIILLIMLY
jgi:hypothetical protein